MARTLLSAEIDRCDTARSIVLEPNLDNSLGQQAFDGCKDGWQGCSHTLWKPRNIAMPLSLGSPWTSHPRALASMMAPP